MISAIILNYLNVDLTRRCVETLLSAGREASVEFEVLVVDNSAKKTSKTLHKILPDEVTIIENEANDGFSKANNRAASGAKGEHLLIMNNDLFINAEVLSLGLEYLRSQEDTGVWAPKLTDEQGKPQRSCAHFPTLTGLFTEYLLKIPYDNQIAIFAAEADQPVRVDTVIGACMLMPKAVFEEVNGFDEDYFFNVEDVDLCLRVKKNGYEVIFDPRCSAIHLVGASQQDQWYNDRYMHKARILYFKKNHHWLKASIAKWVILSGLQMRRIKHEVLKR